MSVRIGLLASQTLNQLSEARDRIAERLNDLLVRKIELQIRALEHELAIARLAGRRSHPIDYQHAENAIEQARKAFGRE
jgi:hypothetical protein